MILTLQKMLPYSIVGALCTYAYVCMSANAKILIVKLSLSMIILNSRD